MDIVKTRYLKNEMIFQENKMVFPSYMDGITYIMKF